MVIDLEEFTCAIYEKSRHTSVHDLRYSILQQKCINLERNIDLNQFPSCRKTLSQHIRRVNETGIWKLAHISQPLESDDDVAGSSEEEVLSDDSAVVESDSDED